MCWDSFFKNGNCSPFPLSFRSIFVEVWSFRSTHLNFPWFLALNALPNTGHNSSAGASPMLCKGTQLLIGTTSVYTCLLIFACYCTSINVAFILFVVFYIPRLFHAKMWSKSLLHSKSVLMTSHGTLDLCILPYRNASCFFFSEQFSNLLL